MDGHRKADIKLEELLVNPENYRFDIVNDQQEAMSTMLRTQKDKILKLARDIAQRGLNPMERLVVKEIGRDRYVVLDGNRRTTALKLMTNPDELPNDYQFKGVFEELHTKYKDILPTTLECVVFRADQQDNADSWIELKHTGENQGVGTVSWNTIQKQRFASRHAGQEPKTLQVLEFIKQNGIDVSGIDLTNLERLLGTKGVPQMLGIDFPRKKKFILIESQELVLQRFRKVVERMSADDFAVAQIYIAVQRIEWVRNVIETPTMPDSSATASTRSTSPNGSTNTFASMPTPAPVQTSAPTPTSAASASASMSNPAPVPGSNTNPSPNTANPVPVAPQPVSSSTNTYQTLINPNNPPPATSATKVIEVYKELQTVYLTGSKAAPHAVGALLRILLEVTAQEYLMKTQNFRYDKDDLRNPTENNKTYSDLRSKLNYIINGCGLPAHVSNVLRVLVNDQLVITTLNQVMHNTLFTADAAAIKGLWKNFEKVFDYLIREMK